MPSYHWVAPKAMVGDQWWFSPHPRMGAPRRAIIGEVMVVETHYHNNGLAYHLYHMQVRGYARRRIVGGTSLVKRSELEGIL